MFAGTGPSSGKWNDITSKSASPWKPGTGSIYNHGGTTYHDGILLVGGNENKNSDQLNPESTTWIWNKDDTKWKQVSNVVSPAFRDYHAIASLEGGRAVMFGGRIDDGQDGSDTLIFDSDLGRLGHGGWSVPKALQGDPPARGFHAMATLRLDYVIMFGGQTTSQTPGKPAQSDDDTWLFDGSTNAWTEWIVGTSGMRGAVPPARWCHGMASLGDAKSVVMFGGFTGVSGTPPNKNLQDTWLFDTTNGWVLHPTKGIVPGARMAHAMATLREGTVVMSGGWTGINSNVVTAHAF